MNNTRPQITDEDQLKTYQEWAKSHDGLKYPNGFVYVQKDGSIYNSENRPTFSSFWGWGDQETGKKYMISVFPRMAPYAKESLVDLSGKVKEEAFRIYNDLIKNIEDEHAYPNGYVAVMMDGSVWNYEYKPYMIKSGWESNGGDAWPLGYYCEAVKPFYKESLVKLEGQIVEKPAPEFSLSSYMEDKLKRLEVLENDMKRLVALEKEFDLLKSVVLRLEQGRRQSIVMAGKPASHLP